MAAPPVRSNVGRLVLTGGDVAAAVLTAMDASLLWLGGEVAPGQPWGAIEGGPLSGLPIATKAGSFGEDDAFLACVAFLMALPTHGGDPASVIPTKEDSLRSV